MPQHPAGVEAAAGGAPAAQAAAGIDASVHVAGAAAGAAGAVEEAGGAAAEVAGAAEVQAAAGAVAEAGAAEEGTQPEGGALHPQASAAAGEMGRGRQLGIQFVSQKERGQ